LGTFFTVAMCAVSGRRPLEAHHGDSRPLELKQMILSRTVFKLAAAGLVAAGALTVAATANADTRWSVGINVPGVVVNEPAPVYTYPAPTYYQAPRPVYSVPPPVYYEPAARWEERRAERWEERRAERREWRRRQWEREQYHRYYENRD